MAPTHPDPEPAQIAGENLIVLLLVCLLAGSLCGGLIVVRAESVAMAVGLAGRGFAVLTAVLALTAAVWVARRRAYWLGRPGSPEQAVGQVIGMAAGGSLLASLGFVVPLLSIPYLWASFETAGLASELGREVLTLDGYLRLAGSAMLAAVATLVGLRLCARRASDRDTSGPRTAAGGHRDG